MNLRSVFKAVAYKSLAAIDLPNRTSHQHEVQLTEDIRRFFEIGDERIKGRLTWHYFADARDPLKQVGQFTVYDTRRNQPHRRPEWRMYYPGEFLAVAEPGDVLILARTRSDDLHALVFEKGSGWLRAALALFEIDAPAPALLVMAEDELGERGLEFARQQILEELDLVVELPSSRTEIRIAEKALAAARKNQLAFPTTRQMAELAWASSTIDLRDSDATLTTWLSTEEAIFRAIERLVVEERLKAPFETVEDFLQYSLSVQNRRKSRMGQALQHHLKKLFSDHGLRFVTEARTERKNKPDFLFPGLAEYNDPTFDVELLVMLGAKSTCKDRWRQILTEADRILTKHLCTLEQAISAAQTDEMKERKVTLVIPASLHATYAPAQRPQIWTVNEFIDHVRLTQRDE